MNLICPFCHSSHDCTTALDDSGDTPVDGNVSLCIRCGEFSMFDGGKLRKPSIAEDMAIFTSPDCLRARAAWQLAKETK